MLKQLIDRLRELGVNIVDSLGFREDTITQTDTGTFQEETCRTSIFSRHTTRLEFSIPLDMKKTQENITAHLKEIADWIKTDDSVIGLYPIQTNLTNPSASSMRLDFDFCIVKWRRD